METLNQKFKKGKISTEKKMEIYLNINLYTYFSGNDFCSTLFIRVIVAWNSSGATRDCKPEGNDALKLLLKPNLKKKLFDYYSSVLIIEYI